MFDKKYQGELLAIFVSMLVLVFLASMGALNHLSVFQFIIFLSLYLFVFIPIVATIFQYCSNYMRRIKEGPLSRQLDEIESETSGGLESNKLLVYVDYTNMKICSICHEPYGYWEYFAQLRGFWRYFNEEEGNKTYYQKCACKNKSGMPPKAKNQEKWPGFDYNERVTLCYCCGQEMLMSGLKWSVWFCDECKNRIMDFNTKYQQTIIPIGRHSIMAGYRLSGEDAQKNENIEKYTGKVNKLFNRMDHLFEWRKMVISDNLKKMGYIKRADMDLIKYLSSIEETRKADPELLDKTKIFTKLCDFFKKG